MNKLSNFLKLIVSTYWIIAFWYHVPDSFNDYSFPVLVNLFNAVLWILSLMMFMFVVIDVISFLKERKLLVDIEDEESVKNASIFKRMVTGIQIVVGGDYKNGRLTPEQIELRRQAVAAKANRSDEEIYAEKIVRRDSRISITMKALWAMFGVSILGTIALGAISDDPYAGFIGVILGGPILVAAIVVSLVYLITKIK